jgi:hypothetical protein
MQTHNTKARGARMIANRVTPAEAKHVWHILAKPSTRKVAAWFRAAGRPVRHKTIWKWQRAGWPGTSAADIANAAGAALANIASLAPALSRNGPATTAGAAAPNAAAKAAQEMDGRGNAELAEEGLREVLAAAVAVCRGIRDIMTGDPSDGTDALPLLLGGPDGIAQLLLAASGAINVAVGGFRQLGVLRAEAAAAVPRTQTVYPPGEGAHANLPQADGAHGQGDYLRSSIEALDEEIRQIKAGKYAAGRCAACRASDVRDPS